MGITKQFAPGTRPRLVRSLVDATPEVLARELTAHADAIARLENQSVSSVLLFGPDVPEGNVAAAQGSLYIRQAGDSSSLWFKQTGTGLTGWSQIVIP